MFLNYIILFSAFSDPHLALCRLASSFGLPPPIPQSDDVIHEWGNEIKDYFASQTPTLGPIFVRGNFSCFWGCWFDLHHYISIFGVLYSTMMNFFLHTPFLLFVLCRLWTDPSTRDLHIPIRCTALISNSRDSRPVSQKIWPVYGDRTTTQKPTSWRPLRLIIYY